MYFSFPETPPLVKPLTQTLTCSLSAFLSYSKSITFSLSLLFLLATSQKPKQAFRDTLGDLSLTYMLNLKSMPFSLYRPLPDSC